MPRRYPLEPLAKLRKHEVDAETGALAERARIRADAEQGARKRREARAVEEEQTGNVLESERERLKQGQVRPADLEQAERYAEAAAERIERLREAEAEASEQVVQACHEERRARQSLRDALGRAAAIERHRRSFTEERKRETERHEQDAAEELWSTRRGGR